MTQDHHHELPRTERQLQADPALRSDRRGARTFAWLAGILAAVIVAIVLYGLSTDPAGESQQAASTPSQATPQAAAPSGTTGQAPAGQGQNGQGAQRAEQSAPQRGDRESRAPAPANQQGPAPGGSNVPPPQR
jgi:hypothetical protein